MYGNEQGVGEAVRDSGIDRAEVFVTSKLNNGCHEYDDVLRALRPVAGRPRPRATLDLFLIHWPLPARRATTSRPGRRWRRSTRSGRVRAIGVSNFQPHHLRRLFAETEHRAGGQPDRDPPVPRPRTRCGRSTPTTRSRPRRGRRSPAARSLDDPVIDRIARGARQDAGAGDAALARPARRHRVSRSR